jgi:hypothetical protein
MLRLAILLSLTSAMSAQDPAPQRPAPGPGYTDTPLLPGSEWRVHDAARPRPPVVEPPPPAPAPAPADAVVLFDGDDLEQWRGRGGEAKWTVEDGAMVVNGTGDIQTAAEFGDCQLHVEWAAPADVKGSSQHRGNSGVFLMGRYEVQVLDSYDNETYADGQAGALYGQSPPRVNACRPPGAWQSFDIVFEAPRFEGDKLVAPARVTVFHNGVLVHHAVELLGQTAHRAVAAYKPHGPRGPIRLQDHGSPVRFRNVWVRELGPVAPGAAAKGSDAGRR